MRVVGIPAYGRGCGYQGRRDSGHDLDESVSGLLGRGIRTTVLFLDAEDGTLVKRFEETRRTHPIAAAHSPTPLPTSELPSRRFGGWPMSSSIPQS